MSPSRAKKLVGDRASGKLFAVVGVVLMVVLAGTAVFFLEQQSGLPAPVRVACVGDSITAWTGYPEELQMLLGSGFKVDKFGVGGATYLRNSDRPFLDQPEFEAAKRFQPNVVVVLLGTNDARTNIYASSENLDADCVALLSAIGAFSSKPKIYVALPPPLFNNTLSLNRENLVLGVIPRVRAVAIERSLPIIDVYGALVGHPEFFPDGVHPNSSGAKVIAYEVFEAIET